MMDASGLSPAWGTIPQWIAAASTVTGLVWAFLRFGLGWRKQGFDNDADIRDHYAQEVAALRGKLDGQEAHFLSLEAHWRTILEGSDRRHQECEDARQQLRSELSKMHEEIAGLKSQIRAASTDRVLRMEDDPPAAPHSRAAAKRVRDVMEGGDK